MKKVICALMICLIGGLALGAEASFMQAPELPAGVLLVVEWPSLATLQGNVQGFVNAIKPGTPIPPIAAGLVKLTKSADPSLLDQTLPQRLIMVKDAEGNVSPVAVLNVTDTQAFMGSLLPNISETGTSGDLTLFTEERQVFDRKAYMKAPQQERQNFQKFMNTVSNPVVIGTKDKCAFVGKLDSAVKAAMDVVASGKLGTKPVLGDGDVTVFANVKGIMDALGSAEGGALDPLREKMKTAMPFGQMGQQGAQVEAILAAEIDACEALAGQIATCQARLTLDPDQAMLKLGMDAVPGTEMAAYLASVPEGMPDTLKYLPQDAFFVAATRMGDMKPLADAMADFQAKLMAISGMGEGAGADMAKMTADAMQSYGDDFSFAMRPGKGFQMVEVIRLKDAGAAKVLMGNMSAMSEQVTAMYKKMGLGMAMDFDAVAHTYKEREISEWNISFAAAPPEGADPQAVVIHQQQAAAMKAMFGDALMIDATLFDNDWVLAIGGDSLKSLKIIMDGTYAKIGDHPVFQQALGRIPADSEGMLYLHLTDMVKWAMSLASAMSGGAMPPAMANMQFERGPGIVAGFNVSGAQTVCDVRVPTAEIKSLVDGFERMQGAKAGPPPVRVQPPREPEPRQ